MCGKRWSIDDASRARARLLPSLAEILALPELAAGEPEVVAGRDGLGNPVRWVHVSEVPDIAHLLVGGELLLSTGIALPEDPVLLERYVAALVGVGVSGLVIELGRRFSAAPPALVQAAERHRLPVIVLHREVRFVRVTEAAHALIIDSQLEELRASQEIHDTFTDLALEGASAATIVRRAAAMMGCPLLLENLNHQVLVWAPPDPDVERLVEVWTACARDLTSNGRTELATVGGRAWLVTAVGARGESWGRLAASVQEPVRPRWYTVMDRAAVAIALGRLLDRDRQTLERQSHRSLLADILAGTHAARELEARGRALGVPLTGRTLIGCVVSLRVAEDEDTIEREVRDRDLGERLAAAARQARLAVLIGQPRKGAAPALLSLPPEQAVPAAVERFAAAVHGLVVGTESRRLVVAVGAPVSWLRDARRSLREAEQVAAAITEADPPKLYYRLPDVRLRGLLHVLRDDPRLQTFCERELGRLLHHDRRHRPPLLPVLAAYLRQAGNKSEAARQLGLSRPTFYARLERIARILDVDLESPESRLSLHAALLALEESQRLQPAG
ncbi:MAG TPA: PucR family transcriptional regulator ligand-binding domain-containing protein [Candidatus Dormibacteraeota bacterium]|nr:PucR family transcriptional regulator ligand-binding domain-containing protein [Candidatus Dormibacteraeota bacterium]